MNTQSRGRGGFTLIELLIIIVIIGTLLALAIPRFMAAAEKGKKTEVEFVLQQISTAEGTYFNAHGTYTDDMDALILSSKVADIIHEHEEDAEETIYRVESFDSKTFVITGNNSEWLFKMTKTKNSPDVILEDFGPHN